MSGVNDTRPLVQHDSIKCQFNESVCNSKQKWNHAECRCECKELDNWGSCKDDYMCNPNTYDCEYNKACKINEYLDIRNCSYEKRLFGKLVLAWEDEILNATETSSSDEKVTCIKIIVLLTLFHW